MCKNDLYLSVLPDDLQDLVFKFAYGLPKEQVLCSLYALLDIIDMQLPFFFFRKKIWSWDLKKFLHNPVWVFEPMEYYDGNFNSLFDDDAMYCLLLGLDFRRKNVRLFGSRDKCKSHLHTSSRTFCCVLPNADAKQVPYHEKARNFGTAVYLGLDYGP